MYTYNLCLSIVPVGFPCVEDFRILNTQLRGLEIKEVKERLDGLGWLPALRYGKDGLKYSINVRLENAL